MIFRGPTVFAKFMHRHPLQHPGAQAVRNRRVAIASNVKELWRKHASQGATAPLRLLSVACGPASELDDIFSEPCRL